MKKVSKAQKDYILKNRDAESIKDLSENTGLTPTDVKNVISEDNNRSVDQIVNDAEKKIEEQQPKKKPKKLRKFAISEDGGSVMMTGSQSMIDDEIAQALRQKEEFMNAHKNHIHIIKKND